MAKSGLVKLIMKILGKSMAYVSKNDARARDTFLNLPENLRISMGIFGESTYVTLQKTKNQIYVDKPHDNLPADLEIIFKNRKACKKVLLGRFGVAESFARHDILLKGNINTAVALVRIIDLCEYYLFPRLITRKFLPKTKKQFASIKLYFFALFGNAKKICISAEECEKAPEPTKPKRAAVKRAATKNDKVNAINLNARATDSSFNVENVTANAPNSEVDTNAITENIDIETAARGLDEETETAPTVADSQTNTEQSNNLSNDNNTTANETEEV